jgi:putative FmdB family regulatory protein
MPIYEYECQKCGHHEEVLQKFSDPPISKCEKCKGKMRKLISQSTFHLKGTGWYVTDYASKRGDSSTPKTEKTEKKEEKKEAKSSSTDSKTKESSSKSTPKASAKD